MKIFSFFLLLNIYFSFNIDEYYRKQFTNETGDPHLKLTNKTKDSEIPFIEITEDIPRNATLLKIDKSQLLISCSKFPYDEILFQYLNQYFSQKRITSSFYSELYNLILKILYFKYAPLKEIKEEFKTMNISNKEEYQYELNKQQKDYIEAIYSQLNSPKYKFDIKYNKEIIERYKLESNLIPNDVYNFMINAIKLNKNEKTLNFLKSFLFDKKEEFNNLFNYINNNGFSLFYTQYQEFYLGIKNKTDYMKSNYLCVYISPITDMFDIKINLKNKAFSINTYPVLNNSLLLYTKTPIQKKDNDGILTKYFTVSNDNIFFHYNYLYEDYKKYNLNKYIYSKQIDIFVPKKLLGEQNSKKLYSCQLMNICRDIMPMGKDLYKMSTFLGSTSLNPYFLKFGRLLFINEDMLNENNKEQFQLFFRSFIRGNKINDENEFLAYLFFYEQLNNEILNYKNFFNDIINKENEINEYKDLYRLIELNLKLVIKNYNFLLNQMEVILNHDILDNL